MPVGRSGCVSHRIGSATIDCSITGDYPCPPGAVNGGTTEVPAVAPIRGTSQSLGIPRNQTVAPGTTAGATSAAAQTDRLANRRRTALVPVVPVEGNQVHRCHALDVFLAVPSMPPHWDTARPDPHRNRALRHPRHHNTTARARLPGSMSSTATASAVPSRRRLPPRASMAAAHSAPPATTPACRRRAVTPPGRSARA